MTAKRSRILSTAKKGSLLSLILIIATCYFAIMVAPEISDTVKRGMELAVFKVIPSAFPFMIISDLYMTYGYPEKINALSLFFTKLTGIPKYGVRAFISGNISGFPIGAKISSELYTGGGISRKNAEKLSAYSNNPSIPFIMGAVGQGIYGNTKIGVFLLLTTYISSLITMLVFKGRRENENEHRAFVPRKFDLVASIKSAGSSSVNIIFFVTAFFTLLAIIRYFIAYEPLRIICALFLEITSAVEYISCSQFTLRAKISLSAFALSFGSISVMMQSAQFMRQAGLRLTEYLKIKLYQALFSTIISYTIYPIIYILL